MTVVASAASRARYWLAVSPPMSKSGGRKVLSVTGLATLPMRIRLLVSSKIFAWIDSKKALAAEAGWQTLRSMVSVKDDSELDLAELKRLLERVRKTIHHAPNDVRSSMNSFVIAIGSYVQPLTDTAIQTAEKIGPVAIDMGNTSCQVPFAPDSIRKVQKRGVIGKKRKSAKC